MSEVIQILMANFVILMACMMVLWLISIRLRDVSFVDSFWAAGFIVVAGSTYAMTGGGTDRLLCLVGPVPDCGRNQSRGLEYFRTGAADLDPDEVERCPAARKAVAAQPFWLCRVPGAHQFIFSLATCQGEKDQGLSRAAALTAQSMFRE